MAAALLALPAVPALPRRGAARAARGPDTAARVAAVPRALRAGISGEAPRPVRWAAGVVCMAGGGFGDQPPPPPPVDDDENIAFEPKKKKRGPKVVAPQVQQALGQEKTEESQMETLAITGLGLIFLAIMLEGLVLAFSGFLPEGVDEFATNVLYDSFSPTVGFFLACSTAYGIWKSRQM